jgi:hypothetical protein
MLWELEMLEENLNTSGVVDIITDPSRLYGTRIINDSPFDLRPYLFYFDVNGQSIGKSGSGTAAGKC